MDWAPRIACCSSETQTYLLRACPTKNLSRQVSRWQPKNHRKFDIHLSHHSTLGFWMLPVRLLVTSWAYLHERILASAFHFCRKQCLTMTEFHWTCRGTTAQFGLVSIRRWVFWHQTIVRSSKHNTCTSQDAVRLLESHFSQSKCPIRQCF